MNIINPNWLYTMSNVVLPNGSDSHIRPYFESSASSTLLESSPGLSVLILVYYFYVLCHRVFWCSNPGLDVFFKYVRSCFYISLFSSLYYPAGYFWLHPLELLLSSKPWSTGFSLHASYMLCPLVIKGWSCYSIQSLYFSDTFWLKNCQLLRFNFVWYTHFKQ